MEQQENPKSGGSTCLQNSEERREFLLNNMSDVYFEFDENFTIIDVSSSISTTVKYAREELVGKPLEILFANKVHADNLHLKLKIEKGVRDCKLDLLDKSGKKLTAMFNALWLSNGVGKGSCFTGVLRNILPATQAQEDVQQVRDTLEQKVKDRTEELLIMNDYLRREIETRNALQEQLVLSQKKYMTLIELLPQIIFETDHAYNITFANQIAFKLLGYDPGDLEGKVNILDLIVPEEHKMAMENIKRSREEGVTYGNVHTARRKDGTTFPIIIYSNHIIDGDISKGLRGVVIDISELKATKKELIESERKFRDLFETASDIIFIIDFEGKLISANAAAYKRYGYKRSERDSIDIRKLVDPSFLPVVSEKIGGILEGDINTGAFELLTCTKRGEPVWVELTVNVIKEDGRKVSMQGIARDITFRKEADEIIRKSEKELKEKSDSLQESNAALRALIKSIEDEKKAFQEEILVNLKRLISPYVNKLKNAKPDDYQSTLLNAIERNLEEIALPFAQNLKSEYYNLSRQEMQVALFIKEGKQSKEISEIMGLSVKTIEGYRNTIRKKLGIYKRNDSLKAYLINTK